MLQIAAGEDFADVLMIRLLHGAIISQFVETKNAFALCFLSYLY